MVKSRLKVRTVNPYVSLSCYNPRFWLGILGKVLNNKEKSTKGKVQSEKYKEQREKYKE